MSLKTKIRGMTAWVNFRLVPYNKLTSNILMDMMAGTNMKYLVESITGRNIRRLDTMDGLTQQQIQTRIEWAVQELKVCNVIPEDVFVDTRLFAMRNADHVFELLWRLISQDIFFLWERLEFLQNDDPDVLVKVPFKWTPDPPPKKKDKSKQKKSLLAGFGASALLSEDSEQSQEKINWIKFPSAELMKDFKKKRSSPEKFPSPEMCILEIVNSQLKKTSEGRILSCNGLRDLVDSRVLCSLLNSFVPDTFTSDFLLNDRWTINLVLKSAEKMFHVETPFDSEDLAEADVMSVTSYFTFFFMVAFKFRQCQQVVEKVDSLSSSILRCTHELEQICDSTTTELDGVKKSQIKSELMKNKEDLYNITKKFHIDYCRKWGDHVQKCRKEVIEYIHQCAQTKFETVSVPRNISINDLCLSYVINLTLTNGVGFYLAEGQETLTENRRFVVKRKDTAEFYNNFTQKSKQLLSKVLGLKSKQLGEINPEDYSKLQFFFEATSKNKKLKVGSLFLYQIFSGDQENWQRMFIRAAREDDIDAVKRMIFFCRKKPSFINAKESKTGYTALHHAAKSGNCEIVRHLIESGANIDAKDNYLCTPIYLALDGLHWKACHLLVESGCDMNCKNIKRLTPLEYAKNENLKNIVADWYQYYSHVIPRIRNGELKIMEEFLQNHINGKKELYSIDTRCINGSTLLHTASYYGFHEIVKSLLMLGIDINLKDYKGATALHRARDESTTELLLDNSANTDAEDDEGNSPLHVKCYGETNKSTNLTSIKLLLERNAKLISKNKRELLPIHCCAMQGRVDAIKLLLINDTEKSLINMLNQETQRNPPSVVYLAIANDFLQCAQWMLQEGFTFKDKEQDVLLKRILTEKLKITEKDNVVKVLLENGADANPLYPYENSALHYAANLSGSPGVMEILLQHGSRIDALNEDGNSPLVVACQANHLISASVLISHGADVKQRNNFGHAAFDYILDYEDWINSGYFSDEISARLKAYNLKHSRDLVRAISKRVKVATIPFTNRFPTRISSASSRVYTRATTPVSWSRAATPNQFTHPTHMVLSHDALPYLF